MVKPVYLIDASIYIFQAYFSPHVEHYDRQGEDLSALVGFTRFLLQFLRRENPDRLLVAHDMSLFCGFRHELCKEYKSNRELPNANLAHQLEGCVEVCSVLGLSAFASQRFEADDIIGVICHRLRQEESGVIVSIVSRDKDLAQLLVGEEDSLWDYQKNLRRSRSDIEFEWGVRPEQIPDYLGLAGDPVDRISGVPGIGPVAARSLLQEFPSLEAIYENLSRVADLPMRGAARVSTRLEAHREKAKLSKLLATVVCEPEDCDELFSHCDLQRLVRQPIDVDGFRNLLLEYAFDNADSTRLLETVESLAEETP